MKREKIEVVRGSGNVFRDLGHASPDVAQLTCISHKPFFLALSR